MISLNLRSIFSSISSNERLFKAFEGLLVSPSRARELAFISHDDVQLSDCHEPNFYRTAESIETSHELSRDSQSLSLKGTFEIARIERRSGQRSETVDIQTSAPLESADKQRED